MRIYWDHGKLSTFLTNWNYLGHVHGEGTYGQWFVLFCFVRPVGELLDLPQPNDLAPLLKQSL